MKTIVIKLGGSIVAPDDVDSKLLTEFKSIIESYVKKGYHFAIIVGGGKVCRNYQNAASKIIGTNPKTLDWLGIEVTKLNAYFVKTIFGELADKKIVTDYSKKISTKKPILIGAGYKPDWSTSYDAIMLSKKLGGNELIVLSNISHVYDKDPKKFKDAKPYDNLSWDMMLKICSGPWTPGLNAPLDPMAASLGAKYKTKVVFLDGFENLKNYLDKKSFVGTVIN